MNNSMMCIIFASDNEGKMNELTFHRTAASLPFGGRYRFIDFALSNMVNSNITTIGIIATSNYSSLLDHVRMGRDWDLNRKNSGIAVFPPYASASGKSLAKGKIDALYSQRGYIEKSKEDYVVITNGNIASNIDFEDVLKFHTDNGADITVLTYRAKTGTGKRFVISKKSGDRIGEILLSQTPSTVEAELSLNTYLIKKDLLLSIMEREYAKNRCDFEADVLMERVNELNILAYRVKGHSAIIDDIKSYFNESMKLLDADVRQDLFYRYGKIFTKTKDSVPTVYKSGAAVKNSLIADGCVIDGQVENCILFRNVTVEKGAEIKNSIVMEGGYVAKRSQLNYAILDRSVTVREGRTISGFITYPVVIVKGKEV